MKSDINPVYLIVGGLVAILLSNAYSENVYMQGLGVIGLICLVIGIINGIIWLVKKAKKPQPK